MESISPATELTEAPCTRYGFHFISDWGSSVYTTPFRLD